MTREQALALAAARKRMNEQGAAPAAPAPSTTATGLAGNFGAGTQTGIANALGMPVDALTGAINGVGQLTGGWGPIENPVGGSQSIMGMMQPLQDMAPEPNTALERGARRVGEEVGAATAMGPLGVAMAPQRAGAVLAADGVSALTGGTAAAAAKEWAPDSLWAEPLAAIAGGLGGGLAASRAMGLGGTAATVRNGMEDQKMRAADAYGQVRSDQTVLPRQDVDDLLTVLNQRMAGERINPRLQPGSSAVLDAINADAALPMRVEDIENLRRMTQQSLPVTAAPADQRLAGIMRDEITGYLDGLNMPSAQLLREGRDANRRYRAAETVQGATSKAQRRAASTGSGGNEINATRQNLRGLIDNPRKSRSFSAPELAAMEGVVTGTSGGNVARRLSRMAPTSGGLSSMIGMGGVLAAPPVAIPMIAATEAAKYMGERGTRSSVDALMQMIAPDRVLSPGDPGLNPVLQALLGIRGVANE